MENNHHLELLSLIKKHSGKATEHTFSDTYLGNSHPRYAIDAPSLRAIAKDWTRKSKDLTADELRDVLTRLIEGKSSTEKFLAGMILDYATAKQRIFHPKIFLKWLDHLEGWAEVDSVCTGRYTIHQITTDWARWHPIILKISKSKNINKRRAALVIFCSPLRHSSDEILATSALLIVEQLKHETDVRITKAISWVLRSMVKNHKKRIAAYLRLYGDTLPAIARRETLVKLKTGRKITKKI
jgi:3-methyladenine DNA glycosylase AlkD